MPNSKQPVVITALSSKAHQLRLIAAELNLPYEEASPTDQVEVTRFIFAELDEDQTKRLIESVPREVYFYQAVFR